MMRDVVERAKSEEVQELKLGAFSKNKNAIEVFMKSGFEVTNSQYLGDFNIEDDAVRQ